MSRRFRLEEEKAKNIKQDVEEEEDKLKLQRERIFAPVVWQRLASGFRIEDLKENRHEEVLEMIKEFYMPEEVLCRNSEMLLDEVSTQSFLKQMLFNIHDHMSIIILEEAKIETETEAEPETDSTKEPSVHEDILAGALIMKVIHKIDFGRVFSRAMLVEGEAMKRCVALKNTLNRKVDIFVEFNCEDYLRYYALCVKPCYRKRRLGFHLMMAGLNVARSINIPVVMGIFPSFKLQKLAKRIGMRVIHEINYVQYRDEDGELFFDDPGAGNYTCAVMAGPVPEEPPLPEPPKEKPPEEKQKEKKMTRKEKRAAKGK